METRLKAFLSIYPLFLKAISSHWSKSKHYSLCVWLYKCCVTLFMFYVRWVWGFLEIFFIMSVLKVLLNTLPPRLYNLRWVRKSNMKESQRKKSIWNLNTQSKIEFKTVHYVKWEFQIYDFFLNGFSVFLVFWALWRMCIFAVFIYVYVHGCSLRFFFS